MARFDIKVGVDGEAKIVSLKNKVNDLDNTSKTTKESTSKLGNSIKLLAGAAVTALAINKLVTSISSLAIGAIETAAQFEQFETTLKSITGSSEKAEESMKWIEDFTSKTPYELDKVTESFVKMKAYGIEPTNGMLTTLGDTAAAMGKDINQAVEAMADAITGENERLKEFGIKAKLMGEEIAYNWTNSSGESSEIVIQNNKDVIESTLSAIFNEKYAGAMDEQSKTWNGLISNIKDAWTSFQNTIMEAGLFDYIKAGAMTIKEYLDSAFESGKNGAKGFSDSVINMIESTIENFGFLGMAFDTLKLGFKTIEWAVLGMARIIMEALNAPITLLNGIIEAYDAVAQKLGAEPIHFRIEPFIDTTWTDTTLKSLSKDMIKLADDINSQSGMKSANSLIEKLRENLDKLTNSEEKFSSAKDDANAYLLKNGAIVKDNTMALDEYGEKTAEAIYAEELLALGLDAMGNEMESVNRVMDEHVSKYGDLTRSAEDYAQALRDINAEGYGVGTNQVTSYSTVTQMTSPQDYYEYGWELPDDYYSNPAYNPYSEYQGYAKGGYTGDMSKSAVAGVVHGQEYVVNAQTTKDLGLNGQGGTFEAMSKKLDLLGALPELLGSINKLLNVQKQSYAITAAGA